MTITRPNQPTEGAEIAASVRSDLLARKRVGKNGLPLHIVRDDQIKTRWSESEALTIKTVATHNHSNPAVETNTAAIRGFLAMFAESPEMLIHVYQTLKQQNKPIPSWLPSLPISRGEQNAN